jgi:alkylation response protein AidB-like acyl-CoA dehydrogenase
LAEETALVTGAAAFLDGVTAFAAGPVRAGAPGWSMGENPAPDLFTDAADIGLLSISIPSEHGGKGRGFATLVRACEMLAAEDFGFAMSLVNTHNVALRLVRSAPPDLIARHLPGLLSGQTAACTALTEPGAGSDFAAITACAITEDGAWHLSGQKTWIINARRAGLAIVFAHCGEAAGANSIGAFVVDLTQPGVTRHPIDSAFSQTSMGTGRLTFDRVALPPEALILPAGNAFKSIMVELNAARTYVAAMCNAMTRAALSEAAAYGTERHSFGKPLAAHQAWRIPLTQAETDLAGAEALTAEATAQIEAGDDAQLSAARAKIAATDCAQRHLPRLLHAMGAEGLRPTRCFTRHLAAAQIAALTDGTITMLRERVAHLTLPRTDKTE